MAEKKKTQDEQIEWAKKFAKEMKKRMSEVRIAFEDSWLKIGKD